MNVFQIIKPDVLRFPVVFSIPHAGTYFPNEIKEQIKPNKLPPDDTDWFVDTLYDFATPLGITMIKADYSRWVIDLNRNPDNTPLYNDGRVITALCTTTDFLGEPIYNDERKEVSREDVSQRLKLYFNPYHQQLQQLLDEVKQQFGSVLLWDCHSIRRNVPSIFSNSFSDLILGSVDCTSASKDIIDTFLSSLSNGTYSLSHNHPFKGGYITRHYGKPNEKQQALQLEMTKPLYMDDSEQYYDEQRANNIKELLINTISILGKKLLKSTTF